MAKGKHRAKREPINWKWEFAMWRNRYHAFFKPAMRKRVENLKGWFN